MSEPRTTRRVVFECPVEGFRTSPLVLGEAGVPGLDAASVQIAEHALLTHGDADAVQYVMVDMPESAPEGD